MVRCAVALLLATGAVSAQSDETARRAARDLGNEGIELYEKGEHPTALDRLDRAYKVMPVATLGLWSARALEKNGLLVEASERYLEVTRMQLAADAPDVQREAIVDAQREYDALQPRIPTITITLASGEVTSGVEIAVDGAPLRAALLGVPIILDPGRHEFQVTREGKRLRGEVELVEGERKLVELTFKEAPASAPPAAPAPSAAAPPPTAAPPGATAPPVVDGGTSHPGRSQRIAGFAAVGVGVAGLVVGGVGAGLALQDQEDLDVLCPAGRDQCPPSATTLVDEYNGYRTLSSVGFIAGGVAVAGGVALILTAPRRAPAAHAVTPWVGLGAVGVRGRF